MFPKNPNVLFVDDEENNLISLKSSFRKIFNVYTAISVDNAWETIEKENIHIVVSDQRMPKITGVEFFEKLFLENPDIVRILLTGFEDIKPVTEAINKGHIYRFVSKPWEENDLRITIYNAYDRFKTQRLLKLKNQELHKAYNELDHLVYSASHDIRGPLTSILGITQLCRLENTSESLTKYYDYIDDSVQKLEDILQSIVDFSKNSRMDSVGEKIEFAILFESIRKRISQTEENCEKVEIRSIIEDSGDYYGDRGRLILILDNLIRNSIRFANFSVNNSPFVEVSITANDKKVFIHVTDNGIGIHPEETDRIFQMFYRGNNLSKGSGMGLYIVKEAVVKLNGSINLESSSGKGSHFSLELPCVEYNSLLEKY